MIEIICPESCEHLRTGREYETSQEYRRYLRLADEAARGRYYRILSQHEDAVSYFELLIAEERRQARGLTDKDLVEALDLIIATLRTEGSGLLYERTSDNLRVEALRRALSQGVHFLRYPSDPNVERLPLKDVTDCLELVRGMAASHCLPRAAPQSYVDFLARNMPRANGAPDSQSRIIIPGV